VAAVVSIKIFNPVFVPFSVLEELQQLRALVEQLRQENQRLRRENWCLRSELDAARAGLDQAQRQASPFSKGPPEPQPKTNWEGEQAIRPAVVKRKVWGGNRTWADAHVQEVLRSVLKRCRRAGRSSLDFVSQILRAFANPLLPGPILLTPR
jgi:transposase